MKEKEIDKSLHYKWPMLVFLVQVQMHAFRVNDVKAAVDSRKIGYSPKNWIDGPMFGVFTWKCGGGVAEKLDKSVYLSLNQSAENSAKYAFFQTNKELANTNAISKPVTHVEYVCLWLATGLDKGYQRTVIIVNNDKKGE